MSRPITTTYQFDHRVKTTNNQIKKHISQMTAQESTILHTLISNLDSHEMRITNHAKNHISFINRSIVSQTLQAFDVIEFNVTNNKPRVLIRSRKQLNIVTERGMDKANICLVISIEENSVITAYVNCTNDNHKSIDMSRYDESINIIKYAMRNYQ